MKQLFDFTFDVELLEDMHSGSGLGLLGIIDDMHSRDANGFPVVWGTTLKGVMREKAEELFELLPEKYPESKIVSIFGTESSMTRSGLICKSLHFDDFFNKKNSGECYQINFSTSREVHSRSALDKTLRCMEMATAGLKSKGHLQLYGTIEDCEIVKSVLKRVTNIGGRRTRGWGQVRISNISIKSLKPQAQKTDKSNKNNQCQCYRIFLKTVNPVCCADSGYSGNQINTQKFISGARIRGALLASMSEAFPDKKDFLSIIVNESLVKFSNAYPLPQNFSVEDMKSPLKIFPMPLSACEKKENEETVVDSKLKDLPWWADLTSLPYWMPKKNGNQSDLMMNDDSQESAFLNLKRVKSEDFLIFDLSDKNIAPLRYSPQTVTLLKNRVPVSRNNRKRDLRRLHLKDAQTDEKGDLFSIECLSENQFFMAEIFLNEENQEFLAMLKGSINNGWIRIGRGGQPLEICEVIQRQEKESHFLEQSNQDHFFITLESDTILRDSMLNFKNSLEISDIVTFCSMPELTNEIEEIENCLSETIMIRGFNSKTKSFEPAKIAIKRGSVFRVRCKNETSATRLAQTLAQKAFLGIGFGEQQETGFGRFFVNFPCHFDNKWSERLWIERFNQNLSVDNWKEKIASKAISEVKKNAKTLNKISKSHWNFFRSRAKFFSAPEDTEAFLCELERQAAKKAGKDWQTKIEGQVVTDYIRTILEKYSSEFEQQKFFIEIFIRRLLANSKGDN